ncbi:MAG: globin [Acidobacteria bacterium]|nr:globin [Acidobacteriota bacterium]
MDELEIFNRIGVDGFTRLVAAFYRQVPGDDILGPMYPDDDMAGAEERLREFLIGRFGGPQTYMEKRGHPRLRMRHAPYRLDEGARDRWVRLMDVALDESVLPEDVTVTLRQFFHGTATFLRNS